MSYQNKNISLIIIIIVSLAVIVFFAIKFAIQLVDRNKVFVLSFDEDAYSQRAGINFPVIINNKTYRFVFDTGATVSAINSKIMKDLNVGFANKDIQLSMIVPTDTTISFLKTQQINIELGDKKVSSSFYYSSVLDTITDFDGVIGMDVISQYNWCFDFENKLLYFSKKEFYINNNEYYINRWSYELTASKTILVEAIFDNKLKQKVLLDTGLSSVLAVNEMMFRLNMLVRNKTNDELLTHFLKNKKNKIILLDKDNNSKLCIVDKIKIGDQMFTNFVVCFLPAIGFNNNDMLESNSLFSIDIFLHSDKVYLMTKNKEIVFLKKK